MVPPPAVEPVNEKRSSRKTFLVLGAAILLIVGVTSIAAKGYIPLRIGGGDNAEKQLSTETVIAYFPNLSDIRGVEPDPTDSRLFWLFNFAGVILQINTETKEIIDYSQRIHETDMTDLVRVGDTLFIGLQGGGVLQYGLSTGITKQYTEDDGLVSNSNILITSDPADADVLWIGTFRGLSKLTVSSGHIDNFQSEMGIPGSALQPIVFHVDDRYVWVTISSNAYTTGGVARLEKETGVWKSWGYEQFTSDLLQRTRFDTYGAAADGERAVVEERPILYSYNSIQDKWLPILTAKQSDPPKTSFSLKGNHAYYFAGAPKELTMDTGVERDLLDPATLADNGLSADVFKKALMGMSMKLDPLRNRMILHFTDWRRGGPDDAIGIAALDGSQTLNVFPFSVLEKKFGLMNVHLADANGDRVLLNTKDRLVEYGMAKDSIRTLLPYSVNVAKIVGGKVVALNLVSCDMECVPANLVATSSIISLDTGIVEFTATIKGKEITTYYVGNSPDEVYVSSTDYVKVGSEYTNKLTVYKLNVTNRSFDEVGAAFPYGLVPETLLSSSKSVSKKSADGSYTVSFVPSQKGNKVLLSVQHDDDAEAEVRVPVAPSSRTNPFSVVQDIQVTNASFDPSRATIVWVGTNRGLIRLDMSTLTHHLYTIDDGLSNNGINKVVATDTAVIVEHQNGVYVYRF